MHTDRPAIGKWLAVLGVMLFVMALAIAFEVGHDAMTAIMLVPAMVAAGVVTAVWTMRGAGLRFSPAGHAFAPDSASDMAQAGEAAAVERPASEPSAAPLEAEPAAAPEVPACCRSCGTELAHTFFDLGTQAAMETIRPSGDGAKTAPAWPLRLAKCAECHLVQIAGNWSDDLGFHRAPSEPIQGFADVDGIIAGLRLTAASRIVQIASGSGALLRDFGARGPMVLGIEPDPAAARAALGSGVATRVCFFDVFSARKLLKDGEAADLLIARDVLPRTAHLDSFADAARILLKPNGVFLVEFPHLLALIEETRFDAFCHEQRTYFSLIALERLFAAHGLRLLHATRPSGSGRLRVYACRTESTLLQTADVAQLVRREAAAGLDRLETFETFAEGSRVVMQRLRTFVRDIRAQGKTIVAYGESPRGSALLAYCGIGKDCVAYVADPDAAKHGSVLPGTGIQIAAPERIRATRPDFLLVLPGWPVQEVVHQHRYIQAWGGRFGCLALC